MQFATATSFIFNFIIMKKLSRDEMKKVMGGVNEPVNCTASATCANGRTFSCAGNTHTGADGSALGCSAQDGVGVTCYYQENGLTRWAVASCTAGMVWNTP